jgi:hypothetical protein
MPLPSYIICSESGALDQSGRVSHFNVIDKLLLHVQSIENPKKKAKHAPVVFRAPLDIQVVAKWMREGSDNPGDEYEAEFVVTRPGEMQQTVLHAAHFKFDKEFQRFIVNIAFSPAPGYSKSGLLVFESRVRKVKTKTWHRQQCLVPVEAAASDHPESATANGKKQHKKRG